ncbi:hypothetical protein ACFLQ2_04430 [archaeon]
MARKKAKKKAVKRKKPARRKGPDTDLVFVGGVALVAAAAVYLMMGQDAFIWYGVPAAVGVALLYEAYK